MKVQSMQSLSAASTYLAADGLANIEKILALRIKIDKHLAKAKPEAKAKRTAAGYSVSLTAPVKKRADATTLVAVIKAFAQGKVSVEGEAGKFMISFMAADKTAADKSIAAYEKALSSVGASPVSYWVVPRKSKTVPYNAAKTKAKDATYMAKRAVKTRESKSLSDANLNILSVYAKGILPTAMEKEMNFAIAALKKHILKAPATKENVSNIRNQNREARQEEYGMMADKAMAMLEKTGIKETNIIRARGALGGEQLLVKLDARTVMSIGLSSVQAFNKAKKSAEEEE